MHRPKPPPWPSPRAAVSASAFVDDGAQTAPRDRDLYLEAADTVVVPLATADTLPCPRLEPLLPFGSSPTLRMPLTELAGLLRQIQEAGPESQPLLTRAGERAVAAPWYPVRTADLGQAGLYAPTAASTAMPRAVAGPALAGTRREEEVSMGMMPTQLWLGSAADWQTSHLTPRPAPVSPGLWTRLWRWLSAAVASPGRARDTSRRQAAAAGGNSPGAARFALASPPWSAYSARHRPRFRQVWRRPQP